MRKINELSTMLLLNQAQQRQRLATGRLMTPQEVAAVTNAGQPAPGIIQGWFLCGTLHPELFKLAKSHELCHLGKIFISPGGTAYFVLAQQIAHWQHRFVVQLLGDDMRDYLAWLQHSPMRLSLANGEDEETMVTTGPDYLRGIITPDLLVKEVPADLMPVLVECLSVVASMFEPTALVDAALPPVRDVCVTVVQSEQFKGLLEVALGRLGGQAPH